MKKYILPTLVVCALSLNSCDSYLDINVNPNSPQESQLTSSLIFPGAEMAFANYYGDYYRITGGYFAQYYAQMFGTSNYVDYSQWTISSTQSSSSYSNLNIRVLANLAVVLEKAHAEEDWGTVLAATVLRVATYQMMVDAYGELAYTEGLDMENLQPHYDDGQTIYNGILAELDAALENVTNASAVCTNFLYYGQNAAPWIKVANALKLRLLMRQANINWSTIQPQVASLIQANNFPDEDVAWSECFSNTEGQSNPFYAEDNFTSAYGGSQKNVILNLALWQAMDNANDNRLKSWWNQNENGEYWGAISGDNMSTSKYSALYDCRPNMSYNSPVYFITLSDIDFFIAEYYARMGNMAQAEQYFNSAVEASFATAGTTGSSTVLATYPWDPTNWQKSIGTQKWLAESGTNPFEGWCELRRLKYPAFGTANGNGMYSASSGDYNFDDLVPGNLYSPYKVNSYLGNNQVLQRWPYPSASVTRNPNANTQTSAESYTSPIFWAK